MPSSRRRGPALRRGSTGLLLFASAQDEARSRRPTDIALALVSLGAVIVGSVVATIGSDLDVALAELLATLPGFFDPLWLLLFWAPVAWALVLLVAAVVRRRRGLPRDLIAAVAVAVVVAALLGELVRR